MQSAAPTWADALGKAPVDGDERSDVAFATEECERELILVAAIRARQAAYLKELSSQ